MNDRFMSGSQGVRNVGARRMSRRQKRLEDTMHSAHSPRTWSAALVGAALLVAGASPALGQAAAAPAAGTQLPADIVRSLEGRGYTALRDVELDDGVWEVEATSSAGKPVDLVVEPGSGKILHEEPDDND
jgi:hypothetical protein